MSSERIERIKLAWAILWGKDTALTHYVRSEIGRVDKDVVLNCTNIARVFALEGHSGGSAPIVIGWLGRALSWKPIAPLTGEDDEWEDVSDMSAAPLWQNRRCSAVFKDACGSAYYLDGIIFRHPDGVCYTSRDSRVPVTFPYHPESKYVDVEENP
jgi:hypothetical protein